MIRCIRLGDADYPRALCELGEAAPASFSVEGDFQPAAQRVAIVGSRNALTDYVAMVKRIAAAVTARGGVVVSGGALGIDAAAHEGALEAGGRTWVVLGCGAPLVTPQENAGLFREVVKRGGAIIRPFDDETPVHRSRFLARNGVLVALSDLVLIAQAGLPSGTLNAAKWAHQLGRPLWVAAGPPWLGKRLEGSWTILRKYAGARALESETTFIEKVIGATTGVPPPSLTDDELLVFEALGFDAKHPDELTARTGLPSPAVTTALLTLSLGDVVVEGPPGLYRRKRSP